MASRKTWWFLHWSRTLCGGLANKQADIKIIWCWSLLLLTSRIICECLTRSNRTADERKNGVLNLSRSLTVVCFSQWWKPNPFLWCLSDKLCRGNNTSFSWGNESPEVFRRGSWSSWAWEQPRTDSEFSWGKGLLLKIKKSFSFSTKDCKSAGLVLF